MKLSSNKRYMYDRYKSKKIKLIYYEAKFIEWFIYQLVKIEPSSVPNQYSPTEGIFLNMKGL